MSIRKQVSWFVVVLAVLVSPAAFAQTTFSSGSTGADGAFAPTTSQTITVPDSGVFNFTTVNIPSGVTITYLRNAKNTTLTILATGDVQIGGSIVVDGQPGATVGFGGFGGPGAFTGGTAGVDNSNGSIGDGPGAGRGGSFRSSDGACGTGGGGSYQTLGGGGFAFIPFFGGIASTGIGGPAGPKYGTRSLVPLIGGSGGGGGCGESAADGGGGGGGGGAVLIASSGTISFGTPNAPGSIFARGGSGALVNGFFGGSGGSGGGGSGGAIRLVANIITGVGQIGVNGGPGGRGNGGPGGDGGLGFVRMEAFNLVGFTATTGAPISSGLPSSATPANVPTLQIASVGGVNAPASPVGSFQGAPDVVLPANQPNPVTVVVNGFNIPTGTSVNVTATSGAGTSTTGTATLSGTTASSTGSASISLTTGLSVLTATTVVDLAQTGDLKPLFINGEKVDKIEVAAQFGGGSAVTYITHSGHRIRAVR
jgi:hypothetical protein